MKINNIVSNIVSLSVVVLLLIVVMYAINEIRFEGNVNEISANDIGENLFESYLFPFEVLALLLTAAVVGAILISLKSNGSNENLIKSDKDKKSDKE